MENKKINKTIDIQASGEQVWRVLLEDQFNRSWYRYFCEGTHAVTTWEEGSEAIFKDDSGYGIVGKVLNNKPYELLEVEYLGMVTPDGPDYNSKDALQVKGSREVYRLSEEEGKTVLRVTCDMGPGMFDMMSVAWDKAMLEIKKLAEAL